jgi:15-cis-phytoene synthase
MTSVALAPVPPTQLARQVIAHHSKSFALASKLLPPTARDDAAVLYAWCRAVDDAVDGGQSQVARVVVDDARTRAAPRLVSERPLSEQLVQLVTDPVSPLVQLVTDPISAVLQRRQIPAAYPRELLTGMQMDLDGMRYDTVDDLIAYAWRVAGVVGLMMTHVLGVADDDALVPAAHLGIAMQLTNICRDVAEDWQRSRLYVPDELLGSARGLARELGGPLPSLALPPLASAVRELLALADRYYRSADRGISMLPWRAAIAVRSARAVYSAIGDQIARADYDVTAGRAVVSHPSKLARVAAAAARIAASAPRRVLARQRYSPPTRILELADVQRL